MSLTDLSGTLWRERELLELLAFELEEEALLLAAGRARWLGSAGREVEAVVATIQRLELRRAVEVDAVASWLGLPADIRLGQLVDRVPAPWDRTLRQHHLALQDLADEILELATTRGQLPGAVARAPLAAVLSRSDHTAATGTSGGHDGVRPDPPSDEGGPQPSAALVGLPRQWRGESSVDGPETTAQPVADEAPIPRTARLAQPSLLDFLRPR